MARIVRPMKKDPADPKRPFVAPKFCCLGIRPSEIDVDEIGQVVLNRKGMSADWRGLRLELIPQELDDGQNGARGRNMEMFVLGQGTGPFAEGPVAPGLELFFKQATMTAGEICPAVVVPKVKYDQAGSAERSTGQSLLVGKGL